MKKLIILATAALSITACSNSVPSDSVTVVEPDRVFTSKKEAKEVATCIENKWSAWVNKFEDWGEIETESLSDAYNIAALKYGPEAYDGAPLETTTKNYSVEVNNIDNGSETKLYQSYSINLGSNPFFSAVDKCQ